MKYFPDKFDSYFLIELWACVRLYWMDFKQYFHRKITCKLRGHLYYREIGAVGIKGIKHGKVPFCARCWYTDFENIREMTPEEMAEYD